MELNNFTNSNFVNMHGHSSKSFGDSIYPVEKMVSTSKQMGFSSVCLTDHGSLVNLPDLAYQAEKEGIKWIVGVEAYFVGDDVKSTQKSSRHLLTIVENEEGYANLLKLIYKSSIPVADGGTFYVKPRFTDKEIFAHQNGLTFSSACLNGVLNDYIKQGDETSARIEAMKWKENVENFYIEIMPHRFQDQIVANNKLVEIARDLDIPLLCTLDVHYEREDQHEAWLINGAIRRKQNIDTFEHDITPDMYFKSVDQIIRDLKLSGLTDGEIEEAINNTITLANRCNFKWQNRKHEQPVFNADINAPDHLKTIAWQGLCMRFGGAKNVPPEYVQRLKIEWEVVSQMGYADYFLILHDMVYYAKSNNVNVGPGRGSACGSMMLWALHVTEVDSLKYKLPFERFLNPERLGTSPDVDMDLDPKGREQVINYLKGKYGIDHVLQVANHAQLRTKAAVKDVARFFNYSFDEAQRITDLIPIKMQNSEGEGVTPSVEEVMKLKDIQPFVQADPKLFSVAKELENSYRQCLTGDTKIYITNNHSITIEELFNRKTKLFKRGNKMGKRKVNVEIRACDTENMQIKGDVVVDVFEQGKQEVFEITTKSGKKIKATKEHLFLTKNGWVKLDDLIIGDKVFVNGKAN